MQNTAVETRNMSMEHTDAPDTEETRYQKYASFSP